MSSSVAVQSKPTFSAPVVQSRLKHHHAQQQLQQSLKPPKPEARHQRSKSLPKGRRIYPNGAVQSRETTANAAVNNNVNNSSNLLTNTPNRNPGNRGDGLDLSDRERYPTGLGIDVDQLLEEAKSKWQQQQQQQQQQHQQHQQQRQRQHQHQQQQQQQQHSRQQRGGRRRHQHSDSVEESRVVPQVIVLRRPQSATDFVKHTAAATPLGSTVENDEPAVGQNDLRAAHPSRQQQPHARRAPSKERRRSDVPSSKAKRVQRRKDVKSMTDVLQIIDSDLLLGASPPPPARPYDSADERDVHSITTNSSAKQVTSPVLGHHYHQYVDPFDGEDAHKDNRLFNLFNEPSTARAAAKRHSDSFGALPSIAINAAMPRRKSSTAVELQNQLARFKEFPAIEEGPRSESVRPSTLPGVHGSSPGRRMPGNLYAGPTFHNSPAPSDLPMPSFLRQSVGSASTTSPLMRDTSPGVAPNAPLLPKRSDGPQARASPPGVAPNAPLLPRKSVPAMPFSDLSDDEGVFPMDDVNGLSHADDMYARQQQSLELLQMLSRSHVAEHRAPQTPTAAYNVPERMATSRPLQVYPAQSLNEISESLRSLLKIPGQ